MNRIFKLMLLSGVLSFIVLFYGCSGVACNRVENSIGTNLVSSKVLDDINASTILNMIKSKIDKNATNAFNYKAIKITYHTTNIKGKTINASGLLVIPTPTAEYMNYLKSKHKSFTISAVCDNHGTIFLDNEAPTKVEEAKHIYPTALLMSGYAGFAFIAPDYLGYGDSKGEIHPYMMKKAAEASLDMIRASIRYMKDNHIAFNGQLYLSGYSEGGYIAMAMAKEIQENPISEFQLMGVAPMAGPYDINALAKEILKPKTLMKYPAILAEIAYSYSKVYDINISNLVVKSDVFNNLNLFNGDCDSVCIHKELGLADVEKGDYGFNTHYVDELFKRSFINDYFSNPNNKIKRKFALNSVYRWIPKMKMNLIQCKDDEIIPFTLSSQKAYEKMSKKNSTTVTLSPISTSHIPPKSSSKPFIHQRCADVAYKIAIKWFSKIRSEE